MLVRSQKKLVYAVILTFFIVFTISMSMAATLSGYAWLDMDTDSVRSDTENMITGVPMIIERLQNSEWVPFSDTSTDAAGSYSFENVSEGTWRLKCPMTIQEVYAGSIAGEIEKDGYHLVCKPIEISGDEHIDGLDVALWPTVDVKVFAFKDSNEDGRLSKNEKAEGGLTFTVYDNETPLFSATVDQNGYWSGKVPLLDHGLTISLPDKYTFCKFMQYGVRLLNSYEILVPAALTANGDYELYLPVRNAASISGKAFEDINNNGLMDEDEPGVPGLTVHISGKKSGYTDSYKTDETGLYHFGHLLDDSYTLTAELPEGMLFARYSKTGGDLRSIFTGSTTERQFIIKKSTSLSDKNIGTIQKGAISGIAFLDLNYNGIRDEGEPPYAGVTLEAYKVNRNECLGKTVTGKDGLFRIENLRGGEYRLRAILPDDGSIFTKNISGKPSEVNLFEQRTGRREYSVQPITITSGGEAEAIVGVARGASVTGIVFEDADYNGIINGKEKMISGLKVSIIDNNGTEITTSTTNAKGKYTLDGILPGEYRILVQRKTGYGFTRLRDTQNKGNHIAELIGDFGYTPVMNIEMGQTLSDVNAGMLPSATVTGYFFHDLNDNGLRDASEPGYTIGKVNLHSSDDEIDLTVIPDETGMYFFDGVMPGKYTLTYEPGPDAEMARTVNGGNTVSNDKRSIQIQVRMGESHSAELAGAVQLGNFSGIVWQDHNANGILDSAEETLSGASVTVIGSNGSETQVLSDENGRFDIRSLRPAEYNVNVRLPEGYVFSAGSKGLPFGCLNSQDLPCSWNLLTCRSDVSIGAVKPASVSGAIWMDEDMNGIRSAEEWVRSGLTVTLVSEDGSQNPADTITTDSGYSFAAVRPGEYHIEYEMPFQSFEAKETDAAFSVSGDIVASAVISLAENESITGLDSGIVSYTSIAGRVMLEENTVRNPVQGVCVSLCKKDDSSVIAQTVTDQEGNYRFDGLWPAEYTVNAKLDQGMIFVRPDDRNYPEGASVIADIHGSNGESEGILLQMARDQLSLDILAIKPAKVGDIAWLDLNDNGLVDAGEPRLSGIRVSLVQDGEEKYTLTTGIDGYYLFGDVYPGEYIIKAQADSSVRPAKHIPGMIMISSCLTNGTGSEAYSDPIQVVSGSINLNNDIGFAPLDSSTLPSAFIQNTPARDWSRSNQMK